MLVNKQQGITKQELYFFNDSMMFSNMIEKRLDTDEMRLKVKLKRTFICDKGAENICLYKCGVDD